MNEKTSKTPVLELESHADLVGGLGLKIQARLVLRGESIGFDRAPNEKDDKVVFVLPATKTDRERLVGIINAETVAKISGQRPFQIAPSQGGEFTLSAQESQRLSSWAQAAVASLAVERDEVVKHGTARIITYRDGMAPSLTYRHAR